MRAGFLHTTANISGSERMTEKNCWGEAHGRTFELHTQPPTPSIPWRSPYCLVTRTFCGRSPRSFIHTVPLPMIPLRVQFRPRRQADAGKQRAFPMRPCPALSLQETDAAGVFQAANPAPATTLSAGNGASAESESGTPNRIKRGQDCGHQARHT